MITIRRLGRATTAGLASPDFLDYDAIIQFPFAGIYAGSAHLGMQFKHPQLLSDFFTIEEIAERMLKELDC